MARIELTPGDFKAGMPMDAGWYKGTIKSLNKEMNKSKTGVNYVPTVTVVDNDGDERDLKKWISLAYKPNALVLGRLVAALEGRPHNPKEKLGFDDNDLPKHAGDQLWVHVIQDVNDQGKLVNDMDNFLPLDTADPTQVPF